MKNGKQKTLRSLGLLPFIAAGVWLAYSKIFIDHDMKLPEAIDAKRIVIKTKNNVNLNYYVEKSESGDPLVLIHGTHLAASAYDVVPFFEYYRTQRPVFALELPGYGFSQRPDRYYSPNYFSESLLSFLESQVKEPADVLAIGRSSEFVARAILALPNKFKSVTFILPTGLEGSQNESEENWVLSSAIDLLTKPFWSQAVFDLLTSRPLIKQIYQNQFIHHAPRGYLDYAYWTAHQMGAMYAPFGELRSDLATPDVLSRFYSRLTLPVLTIYDGNPKFNFDRLPKLMKQKSNWQGVKIPASNGMPQFDQLQEVIQILDHFYTSSQID